MSFETYIEALNWANTENKHLPYDSKKHYVPYKRENGLYGILLQYDEVKVTAKRSFFWILIGIGILNLI